MKRSLVVIGCGIGAFLLAGVIGAFAAGFAVGYLEILDMLPPGFTLQEMLTTPGIETGALSDLHFGVAGVLFIVNGLAMAALALPLARWTLPGGTAQALPFGAAPSGLILFPIVLMPPLLIAGFIVTYNLAGIPVPPEVGLDLGHVLPWTYVIGLVLAAPLGEEILFRGYVQGGIEALTGRPVVALAVSGFLWAGIHLGQGVPKAIALVPIGLALGFLRARSGSLWPGLLAHVAMNAAGLAFMIWLANSA